MRVIFRELTWLLLAGFLIGCSPAGDRTGRSPNIVVIVADDLGWADLGVYGSSFHETPNLDALAADGLRFTHAYTAGSVCSPSRASILTSHYPARLGLTDWLPGQGDEAHQRLLQVRDHAALPLDEITLAEALGREGYATAHIGKWHLGREGHRPSDQGFDRVIGANDYGSPPTYFWPYRGGDRDLPELTATGEPGENLTDRLGEEAAKFIRGHRDRPFFLFLSFYAPHTPLEGKPALVEAYREKARAMSLDSADVFGSEGPHVHRVVQNQPVYAAMVETLDRAVGRVLESLESEGLSENTVVVFLSDNGGLAVLERSWPLQPPTTNLPLRAGKGWLYEGGIRGPMMIRWPGVIAAGRVTDTPVITNDLFPTLLAAVGAAAPDSAQNDDGENLLPFLRGEDPPDREALFWHYPHYHGSGHRPSSAILLGHHKLIQWYDEDRVELYDLARDPGETRNLSSEQPALVRSLRTRLADWLADVDAQMPQPNPDYAGPGDR